MWSYRILMQTSRQRDLGQEIRRQRSCTRGPRGSWCRDPDREILHKRSIYRDLAQEVLQDPDADIMTERSCKGFGDFVQFLFFFHTVCIFHRFLHCVSWSGVKIDVLALTRWFRLQRTAVLRFCVAFAYTGSMLSGHRSLLSFHICNFWDVFFLFTFHALAAVNLFSCFLSSSSANHVVDMLQPFCLRLAWPFATSTLPWLTTGRPLNLQTMKLVRKSYMELRLRAPTPVSLQLRRTVSGRGRRHLELRLRARRLVVLLSNWTVAYRDLSPVARPLRMRAGPSVAREMSQHLRPRRDVGARIRRAELRLRARGADRERIRHRQQGEQRLRARKVLHEKKPLWTKDRRACFCEVGMSPWWHDMVATSRPFPAIWR